MKRNRNGSVQAMNKRHPDRERYEGSPRSACKESETVLQGGYVMAKAKMKAKVKLKESMNDKWSHHDTMIVNLRDWVRREIENLRNDIASDAPQLSSSTSKLLKSTEDMNVQLFDLIRSVVDLAEKQAKKKPEKAPAETEVKGSESYMD
jgi:hypothetical protein